VQTGEVEMSTPDADDAIATELVAARAEGRSLTGFPGAIPGSMAEAYRIQDRAIALWPDTLAGWKIGFIPPDRRSTGEPDRLIGPIWRKQFQLIGEQSAPTEVGIFASGFAAVEAELVIRLGQDLPAHAEGDWTAEEAAGLEQQLLIGIEVASSPIPDINSLGPTVIAADFGNNHGLVVGALLADRAGDDPIELASYIDGQPVGGGTSANLPGGMHHGLATALNILTERRQPVRAGMVFATGAITGIHEIRPGQHCRIEVRGGPSVELRTADLAQPV
jgi:2-keto-4-pentenoate hydratase